MLLSSNGETADIRRRNQAMAGARSEYECRGGSGSRELSEAAQLTLGPGRRCIFSARARSTSIRANLTAEAFRTRRRDIRGRDANATKGGRAVCDGPANREPGMERGMIRPKLLPSGSTCPPRAAEARASCWSRMTHKLLGLGAKHTAGRECRWSCDV